MERMVRAKIRAIERIGMAQLYQWGSLPLGEFFSVSEAATMMGLRPKSVWAQIREGKIAAVPFAGGLVIHSAEIQRVRNERLLQAAARAQARMQAAKEAKQATKMATDAKATQHSGEGK